MSEYFDLTLKEGRCLFTIVFNLYLTKLPKLAVFWLLFSLEVSVLSYINTWIIYYGYTVHIYYMYTLFTLRMTVLWLNFNYDNILD